MAVSAKGYNFIDSADLTWTITPDGTIAGIVDVEATVTGGGGGGGSTWYAGTGAPSSGLGAVGDMYLEDDGEIWKKTGSSTWTDQSVNIKGATGATGAAGSTGATGADGSKWYVGSGAPGSGTGVNGDFYLNTVDGVVYTKSGGAWGSTGFSLLLPRLCRFTWAGRVPTTSSRGIVWETPYDSDGSTLSFTIKQAIVRMETAPSADKDFRFSKASGGDVAYASETDIVTLTVASGHYRDADTGLSVALSSGDLVTIHFPAGSNEPFSAYLMATA